MTGRRIRRLDDEAVGHSGARGGGEDLTLDEVVLCATPDAAVDEEPVGAMIRRVVGPDGTALLLPEREFDAPIDFSTGHYAPEDG